MRWLYLIFVWQVDQAITLCSEMHNIKEAIYENKSKLEGIGEDYQIQVSDDVFCFFFLLHISGDSDLEFLFRAEPLL